MYNPYFFRINLFNKKALHYIDYMPIYPNKRNAHTRPAEIHLSQVTRKGPRGRLKKFKTLLKNPYATKNLPLARIELRLKTPLQKEALEFVTKLKRKPVIVDWGCERGRAIKELSNAPELTGRVKAYGFGDLARKEWLNKDAAGVTFIHSPAEDFRRYFKDKSIDIIYSLAGIEHVESAEYVRSLLPKLTVGGKLVTTIGNELFEFYEKYLGEPFNPHGNPKLHDMWNFFLPEGKYRLAWNYPILTIERTR